jgi:predicted ATP-dependent Lon-type protease
MAETINIEVVGYNRVELNNTVNTTFTEFGTQATTTASAVANTITIPEFFDAYNTLFYQIPKTGETNSHEYLVKQSSEYIGGASTNLEIEALQAEITNLRQENLQLQQAILTLTPAQ